MMDINLEYLLGDISRETFFGEYWESKALWISRDDADYFGSLFRLSQLDLLFSSMGDARITLVRNDVSKPDERPEKDHISPLICDAYDRFYQGNTLVVNGVHLYWDPIRRLCNHLMCEMGFKSQVNMYVSPPNSTGFAPHWDDHDVFILQIDGEKVWRLSGGGRLPRRHYGDRMAGLKQRIRGHGEDVEEILMKPGDLLYMPRGVVHDATATDSSSLHLTLGVYVTTFEEMMVTAIKASCDRNPALLKALPVYAVPAGDATGLRESFEELARDMVANFDVEKTMLLLKENLIRELIPEPSGHFSQISKIDELTLDTLVRRRTPSLCHYFQEDDMVGLLWPGHFQKGPEKLGMAFEFIAGNQQFRVGDIPGWYHDDERLRIVRHLIRKGFLCFA